MFKLNRKVEFALIALKYMSIKRPGELTTAKEVSDHFHCSFDTTARVMQVLAQKGYLHAEHGVNGGYQIVKDLAKISLYDLSLSLLGPTKLVRCLEKTGGGRCAVEKNCNILSPLLNINQRLNDL